MSEGVGYERENQKIGKNRIVVRRKSFGISYNGKSNPIIVKTRIRVKESQNRSENQECLCQSTNNGGEIQKVSQVTS